MTDRCNHDLFEQDTYIADGYCPLCLLDLVQTKDAEIERLRADYDECYQDLISETLRANTAEGHNDKLQAVVDAAKRIGGYPSDGAIEQLDEALAALEKEE